MSQQHELTNNLTITKRTIDKEGNEMVSTILGKRVFEYFYKERITVVIYKDKEYSQYGIRNLIRSTKDVNVYNKVNDIHLFNLYFRHLYRIIKYINESKLIETKDKYEYAAIVRAQLSEYELLMLFYNALNVKDNGIYKFKSLIETYALFNNLRIEELARHEDVDLYSETAYRL